MEKENLLEVKNLKKSYNHKSVLYDLSFFVARGEIVGLLGANGAGKTTAFYIAMGLIKPDSGSILFQNRDITSLPVHKRAQMGIGYLSQEPSIFRSLTVEENLLTVLETLNLTKQEKLQRLSLSLEEMSLTNLAKKKSYTLSGGEKRRVEVARALIRNPLLLLLDEPFTNIDPKTISDLKKLILQLKSKGIAILITDHNAREIFSLSCRNYLLSSGEILASGTTKDLIDNPTVRKSYLGQDFHL